MCRWAVGLKFGYVPEVGEGCRLTTRHLEFDKRSEGKKDAARISGKQLEVIRYSEMRAHRVSGSVLAQLFANQRVAMPQG
jgi:hypothetical protein